MNTLLLRCEASAELGIGHAMRLLALAQEWRERGGAAVFAMAAPDASMRERLVQEGFSIETIAAPAGSADDGRATARLAGERQASWLALDGPFFGAAWEAGWTGSAHLLRIDDNGIPGSFCADVLLNQNLGATPTAYPNIGSQTRSLLGPRYALLRREFHAAASRRPTSLPRIVVTMGGTDPAGATERVLSALSEPTLRWLSADIVIGAGNPRRSALEALISRHAPRWVAQVAPVHLPELFLQATLVVTAGGSTLYELASLGVPMLMVAIAENQRATCERFAAADAAAYAGWHAELTPATLAEDILDYWTEPDVLRTFAARAGSLVDGYGAVRVVDALGEAGEGCAASDCRRSEAPA